MAVCLFHVTTISFLSELSAAFSETPSVQDSHNSKTPLGGGGSEVSGGVVSHVIPVTNGEGVEEWRDKGVPKDFKDFVAISVGDVKSTAKGWILSAKAVPGAIIAKVRDGIESGIEYLIAHPKVGIPVAVVAAFTVVIAFISLVMDLQIGTPLGSSVVPNFQALWRWATHPSDAHPMLSYTPDYRHAQSSYHREMLRRDGLEVSEQLIGMAAFQQWLNDNGGLMSVVGGAVTLYRHGEAPAYSALADVSTKVEAMREMHHFRFWKDGVCDVSIDSVSGNAVVGNCREANRPDSWQDVQPSKDAELWLLRKGQGLESWKLYSAHIVPRKFDPSELRYPSAGDTTPNPLHKEGALMRCRLMQTQGNQTLPEAMEVFNNVFSDCFMFLSPLMIELAKVRCFCTIQS